MKKKKRHPVIGEKNSRNRKALEAAGMLPRKKKKKK
jgi:hypothetical protein